MRPPASIFLFYFESGASQAFRRASRSKIKTINVATTKEVNQFSGYGQ
jgi:hypothetical protein